MMTALLVGAWLLAAQQTPPQAPAPVTADDLPVSINRIQRALAGPPPIALKEAQPVFRLEIFGARPTLEDILGERFWLGPAPYGGMTHQEFLDMATPKMAQAFGGFSGKYLLAQTALTLMEQWALKSAIRHFKEATSDREREAARKEVLEALADLERARRQAGLSDK